MAYQVPKPPMTEPNFRERRPPAKKPSAEKKRERAAPGHLDKIRLLPCCACGEPGPSHAHHLKTGRGSATKAPNDKTVPLCHECHLYGIERAGTRNEEAWFLARGVRCFELAAALHGANHNIVAMLKVLHAHKEGK